MTPAPPAAAAGSPAPAPAPAAPEPRRAPEPVVIDPGGDAPSTGSPLAAAAAAERRRRNRASAPVAEVTDKNLADHAVGKLTISGPTATSDPEDAAIPSATGEATAEPFWRDRMRTLREAWAEAVGEIESLEGSVAELRRQFYAEDDPYVRDARVKPEWDRAMARLEETRARAARLEQEVSQALEDGRRAGALPGWLREGLELEPTARPYDRPVVGEPASDDAAIVGEPDVVDEDPR